MTTEETLTLWQRFLWWWWTRVPPRRCCGCACKMLPGWDDDADDDDPRVESGTHGFPERWCSWGLWVCYSCVHYAEA